MIECVGDSHDVPTVFLSDRVGGDECVNFGIFDFVFQRVDSWRFGTFEPTGHFSEDGFVGVVWVGSNCPISRIYRLAYRLLVL